MNRPGQRPKTRYPDGIEALERRELFSLSIPLVNPYLFPRHQRAASAPALATPHAQTLPQVDFVAELAEAGADDPENYPVQEFGDLLVSEDTEWPGNTEVSRYAIVNANLTTRGVLTIEEGAMLGGTGTITGPVQLGKGAMIDLRGQGVGALVVNNPPSFENDSGLTLDGNTLAFDVGPNGGADALFVGEPDWFNGHFIANGALKVGPGGAVISLYNNGARPGATYTLAYFRNGDVPSGITLDEASAKIAVLTVWPDEIQVTMKSTTVWVGGNFNNSGNASIEGDTQVAGALTTLGSFSETGDVYAGGTISLNGSVSISGATISESQDIWGKPFLATDLRLSATQVWAVPAGGLQLDSFNSINLGNGGIVYFRGGGGIKVKGMPNITGHGTIVADGPITVAAGASFGNSSNPAQVNVVALSSLEVDGYMGIVGSVYSAENINVPGGMSVTGAVVVGGDLTVSSGFQVQQASPPVWLVYPM